MEKRDHPFQYAILRLVPAADRGEQINIGVVMLVRSLDYLGLRAELDQERMAAIAPHLDAEEVEAHLTSMRRIADGNPSAGLMARLPIHERFHWLTSPSSTAVQPSELHTGLCTNPGVTLSALFTRLVQ